MTLGQKLREFRKKAGLSQEQLAEKLEENALHNVEELNHKAKLDAKEKRYKRGKK